jgi:hypothetical protein
MDIKLFIEKLRIFKRLNNIEKFKPSVISNVNKIIVLKQKVNDLELDSEYKTMILKTLVNKMSLDDLKKKTKELFKKYNKSLDDLEEEDIL